MHCICVILTLLCLSNCLYSIVYQLPIYDEPEPVQFEYMPEWETAFHRQVSHARKWTWSYLDSIQVHIKYIGREMYVICNPVLCSCIRGICFIKENLSVCSYNVKILTQFPDGK